MILADAVDDLERVRIATDNRIRSLIQVKGLEESLESMRLATMREKIAALEHSATLDLQRAMRAHPLGPWVKRTVGVGEKQAARLLAAIGDPAERSNPAKLWQYCGHGDPARSHCRKGQLVEHSPIAKMRTRLIAESCMKQMSSPYRAVYDRERAKWADRDTTDLHKHNHALRVVGKAMLLDLWREARELSGDHIARDTHRRSVPAHLRGSHEPFGIHAVHAAADFRGDHMRPDSQAAGVPADLRGSQSCPETQISCAAADLPPTTPDAELNKVSSAADLRGDHANADIHSSGVPADLPPTRCSPTPTPMLSAAEGTGVPLAPVPAPSSRGRSA